MWEVFSARTWATILGNLCNICFGGSLSPPSWILCSLTSIFTGVPTYVKASYGLNGVWYWHICNIFSNTGAAIEGSDVNVLLRFVWVEICHPSKHQGLFSSLLFPFFLVFYFGTLFLHFLAGSLVNILSSKWTSCGVKLSLYNFYIK